LAVQELDQSDVFASEGIRVIRTPIRAPNANAFAERWIATLREECLDWLLILGPCHLDRVLRIYVQHYTRRRPHSRPGAWGTGEHSADRRDR
jgi:putative transposase